MREEVRLAKAFLSHSPSTEIADILSDNDPKDMYGFSLQSRENEDFENLISIMRIYFWNATPLSKQITKTLNISKEKLLVLYEQIKKISLYQEILSKNSIEKRQISFAKEFLSETNISNLRKILHASNVIPLSVEFHPSPTCNLRCKGCSSIDIEKNIFLGYPKIAKPLDTDKIKLMIDMFYENGVRKFAFSGGGEPCISDITFSGIKFIKNKYGKGKKVGDSSGIYLALYTNGVFSPGTDNENLDLLTDCVDRIRFSLDAFNEIGWMDYKNANEKKYNEMLHNLKTLVRLRNQKGTTTKIGASCLLSKYNISANFDNNKKEMINFLKSLDDIGLDFCDIKELAISSYQKASLKPKFDEEKDLLQDIIEAIEQTKFSSLNVVFDDSLLNFPIDVDNIPANVKKLKNCFKKSLQDRCWVAITGRILTIGPYGELQPCCDADNPGFQKNCYRPLRLGVLTDFEDQYTIQAQFQSLWDISLKKRMLISRGNCPYCVPSNFNFNFVIEKLYQDWVYGIPPESQPVSPGIDVYLKKRGQYSN